MSNSRKKVIVRRLAGDTLPGYLPLSGFVRGPASAPVIDLLDLAGRVVEIACKDIKTISFVRDFNLSDSLNPERLTRRTFLARPRSEGLWVRLTFGSPDHSPDLLEGLAATDVSLMDSLIDDFGLSISPPDIRSNTQRIFIPRLAIVDLQLLAVITTPSRKPIPVPASERLRKDVQESLFELPSPPDPRPN